MSSEFFNEYKEALDKHLRDNVIIHHESEFKETKGPKTSSATTVAFCKSENSDTKFVKKHQALQETITEVIAGGLYKALLYDRSPTFKLVKTSDSSSRLELKSNLLKNFITLGQLIQDKKKKKLIDLMSEKFADKDGQMELMPYVILSLFYNSSLLAAVIKRVSKIRGSEESCESILERSSVISVEELNNMLTQIFEQPKDNEKIIELIEYIKKCCVNYLVSQGELDKVIAKEKDLQYQLSKQRYEFLQSENLALTMKEEIKDLVFSHHKELDAVANMLDQERFNAEGIGKQLINHANKELREVEGLEKIITSMMLFGYHDLHSLNIGVMDIEHENRNGSKITKKVYAKVDMSASFKNLGARDYLYYLGDFRNIMFNSRVARENNLEWHAVIDYSKLKEEINKSCDLFIDKSEYVESLIHRALFYEKPLLRTKKELNLVRELAEEIIAQAGLLKKFANSEEFTSLINDRSNLQNCGSSTDRLKKHIKSKEHIIKKIAEKAKGNLCYTNKNKLPTITLAMIAIPAALIAHFVFQASLLTTGIIASCCLIAAALTYCANKPSDLLKDSYVIKDKCSFYR